MMPNQFGLYDLAEVKKINLPIYNFIETDNPGISIDLWTYTDLKTIFGWKLSEEQRKNMIRGFIIKPRMKGYAPLYSMQETMLLFEGWTVKYTPSSDVIWQGVSF